MFFYNFVAEITCKDSTEVEKIGRLFDEDVCEDFIWDCGWDSDSNYLGVMIAMSLGEENGNWMRDIESLVGRAFVDGYYCEGNKVIVSYRSAGDASKRVWERLMSLQPGITQIKLSVDPDEPDMVDELNDYEEVLTRC